MRVEYNIGRTDLAILNLYILPRHRPNWILLLVVAVGFTVWQLSKRGPVTIGLFLGMGAAGIFVGLCTILGAFLFPLIVSLARASNKSGQIGSRVLTLTREGVSNETSSGSGLIKWQAISSVRQTKRYVYIEFTPRCFFVVPKRALGSQSEVAAFYQHAMESVSAARI